MEKRDWELGYNQGYTAGFEEGYDKGYCTGVSLGHNNGFVAALEEVEERSGLTDPVVFLRKLTRIGLVEIVVWGAAAKKAAELFDQLGITVEVEQIQP